VADVYEYAGFRYYVDVDAIGTVRVLPVEGQHWAASKDKHLRAARDAYVGEARKKEKEKMNGKGQLSG
jgi:hypothetical protein